MLAQQHPRRLDHAEDQSAPSKRSIMKKAMMLLNMVSKCVS
jgi:hypothetical protein